MKISIIIPVYNNELLVLKCLDSVYNQDMDIKDFEVVVVNDGSTDNTYNVLLEYSKNKTNLTLLTQENQRQGGARNTALNIAKGEYIWFVDSDDYIESNVLAKLYNQAKNNNLDLLLFSNYIVTNNNVAARPKLKNKDLYYSIKTGIEFINVKTTYFHPWGGIIKRQIIEKNELRFMKHVAYEDNEFMLRLFYYSNRIMFIEENYYYVNALPDSTTRAMSSAPIFNIIKVVDAMLRFSNTIENPTTKRSCYYFSVMTYNTAIHKLRFQDKECAEKFVMDSKYLRKKLLKSMFLSFYANYLIEGVIYLLLPNKYPSLLKRLI